MTFGGRLPGLAGLWIFGLGLRFGLLGLVLVLNVHILSYLKEKFGQKTAIRFRPTPARADTIFPC